MIEKLQKYWAILVCLLGLAGTWTTMQYRLDQQDLSIEKLEEKQTSTDVILNDIRSQLSTINAQLGLIIEGKVTLTVKGSVE